jgi:hypothetical protein
LNPEVLILLKEQHLFKDYYRDSILPRVTEIIEDFSLPLQLETFEWTGDIVYDDLYKVYMMKNPCQQFNNGTDFPSKQRCEQVGLKSLSKGLIAFKNYMELLVLDPLRMNENAVYENVTTSNIFDLDEGVQYTTLLNEGLLEAWARDVNSWVDGTLDQLQAIIVCVEIAILVLYIVAEKIIVSNLHSTYKFYRSLFNRYMPQDVLMMEKRIKAKLVKFSILDK